MKKFIFSLMAMSLAVCFTACNKDKEDEPKPEVTFDMSKILGTWNVVSYSYIEMNTDADTVLVKDVRENAGGIGEITIEKDQDDLYSYTENFTDAEIGRERSGSVLPGETTFDLQTSSLSAPHLFGLSVKTEGGKTVWVSSFTGTSEGSHWHSGEPGQESNYKTKTDIRIEVVKK